LARPAAELVRSLFEGRSTRLCGGGLAAGLLSGVTGA